MGVDWLNPVWIPDVIPDDNFPRAPIAARENLHGAFAFPIVLGQEMLGVLEFFSRTIQQPDPELLQATAALGSQIGQFIERKWAEEGLAQQRHLLDTFMENVPDSIYFKDRESRFLRVS